MTSTQQGAGADGDATKSGRVATILSRMKKWKLQLSALELGDCMDLYYGVDIHQGTYKEAPVLVLELPFGEDETWNQVKRKVSFQVANYSHANLVKLLGCCQFSSEKKGLRDRSLFIALDAPFGYNLEFTQLLRKKLLHLNWKLRVRMMLNIAQAFKYIHSQKREGQLYVQPLQPFRLEVTTESEVRMFYGDVLMADEWKAFLADCPPNDWDACCLCPDVLNGLEILNGQAADVHYMGMLMYFIAVRQLPPIRTLEEGYMVNPSALKGKLPSDVPVGVWSIIEDCVKADPAERPQFSDIVRKLEKLFKSISGAPEAKILQAPEKSASKKELSGSKGGSATPKTEKKDKKESSTKDKDTKDSKKDKKERDKEKPSKRLSRLGSSGTK